ncbi:MAG: hypothetical protein GY874_18230 [Desulfobacteraceae bacterium]|nr:hypothetical protein [Desulfobacteraceae bacterium]
MRAGEPAGLYDNERLRPNSAKVPDNVFRHVGTDTDRNFGDQDPRSLKKKMSTKIAKDGRLVLF